MNDLRDRLQELADGYARTSRAPGPAAARRRGRWRRRRAVGGLVLAGLLVIAASLGLLPALQGRQAPKPVAPPPAPAPLEVPRSTAGRRRGLADHRDALRNGRHHCRPPSARLDQDRARTHGAGQRRLHDRAARRHQQLFDQRRGGTDAELVITETRGQYGPLRSADKPRHVPVTSREAVTVHGHPALLDHDPTNHFLEVTWREPGGVELTVHAKEELGRRQLLAVAEGLRQP